ncbi:MAG TPA: hypothetical protein VF906_02295, partial [Candidatus Bathyarchaeia archaeon]
MGRQSPWHTPTRLEELSHLEEEMLEKAELDLLDSWKFAKQSPFDVSMIASLFMLVLVNLRRGR